MPPDDSGPPFPNIPPELSRRYRGERHHGRAPRRAGHRHTRQVPQGGRLA